MDFDFSEEQDMLRKFARDFMTDKCTKNFVRQMEQDEKGYDPEMWKEMAELGWMGLAFPEQYGGQEMSFLDLTVLLEEMGRFCMPGPFFSGVVLGGLTLLDCGSEEQKKELLPGIAQGNTIVSLALTEADGTFTPDGIQMQATADGEDFILNGTKFFVPDFNVADYVICVVRTTPGDSPDGITLLLVDTATPGISHTMLHTLAEDKQAEVVFNNVRVPAKNVLGEQGKGWNAVERIIQRSALAKCAEMAGGAERVLEMTIEYAKDRIQFGKPIGGFQAVHHHCANMLADVEGSKYIISKAAWMLTEGLPCDQEIAIAKAWVNGAYSRIVTVGHQILGAIGFTEDHDMHFYLRRAKAAEAAFGDADFHHEKIAVEMGL